jgi:hypothetical protein
MLKIVGKKNTNYNKKTEALRSWKLNESCWITAIACAELKKKLGTTCQIQKDANNKQWNTSDKWKETKDTHVRHITQNIHKKNETTDNWKEKTMTMLNEVTLCIVNTMIERCRKRLWTLWQALFFISFCESIRPLDA